MQLLSQFFYSRALLLKGLMASGDNKGSVEETDEEVSKGIPNGGADIKKNVVADG